MSKAVSSSLLSKRRADDGDGMEDKDSVGDGYTYRHSVVRHPLSGRTFWTAKSITETVLSKISKDFCPRSSDVFLCTYIKSGTTWVQAILREIVDLMEGTDSSVEGVSVGLTEEERIPWIEMMAGIVGPDKWTKHLNNVPKNRRRIFKTHCPYGIVKSWCTTTKGGEGSKCIFVVRDPRDVAVSAWHHTRTKNFKYEGPFDHFVNKMFLRGKIECGDWFLFTKECVQVANMDKKNVLLLKYENMVANPRGAVEQIASFLGAKLRKGVVESIVSKTSFDTMKKAEKKGGLRVPGWPHRVLKGAAGIGDAKVPSKSHIRRGGGGKWRSYFSKEVANEFSEAFSKHIGCSIDAFFHEEEEG
eukprot:g5315.t1